MTSGQFFLGIIVLFVATFVYRWQKNIDRETKRFEQRVEAYSKYISQLTSALRDQPFKGENYSQDDMRKFTGFTDSENALYEISGTLFLIGSEEVKNEVTEITSLFVEWRSSLTSYLKEEIEQESIEKTANNIRALHNKLGKKRHVLLDVMRTEISAHFKTGLLKSITQKMRFKYNG